MPPVMTPQQKSIDCLAPLQCLVALGRWPASGVLCSNMPMSVCLHQVARVREDRKGQALACSAKLCARPGWGPIVESHQLALHVLTSPFPI